MLSQTQRDFCGQIVCQYDYYVVYYYGYYHEYQTGEIRDSKILIYCSDQQPIVENGVYSFTECNYYEVTSNKYVMQEQGTTKQFSPLGSSDIVYTNVIEGAPQLCYITSSIRQDAAPAVMYVTVALVAIVVLVRLIFGGRS